MKNQTERYEQLIAHANSMLDMSMDELKTKYVDYPICLMKYLEKEIKEDSIEVRFDNEGVTALCTFDTDNKCNISYLFFDKTEDEDEFIEYLIETSDYDFRKCAWLSYTCYVKIQVSERDTTFCFYK